MDNLPYHVKLFNDRVRQLNQTNGKLLTLNAQEARSLHNDIYELLATIAELTKENPTAPSVISVNMDGGGFK
jgi:benzoyl-CoA reductase/2-hydroxyglutaryl-CoA dehydratase subunit BcrC/BadD/HgdB